MHKPDHRDCTLELDLETDTIQNLSLLQVILKIFGANPVFQTMIPQYESCTYCPEIRKYVAFKNQIKLKFN